MHHKNDGEGATVQFLRIDDLGVKLHRIIEIWQLDAFIEAAIFGMDNAEWPGCPWIWRAEHDVADIDAAMPWRGEVARIGCGGEEESAKKNR
jgi:hypothetical protein